MKPGKTWKQGLATLLAGAMVFGLTPQSCQAAAPVKLAKKRVTLSITADSKGTTYGTSTIKVKVGKGTKVVKVTYKSADKKIAAVTKKGKLTAKKAGKTKVAVTVKYQKSQKVQTKKLTCKVKVVDKTSSEATATPATNVSGTSAPAASVAPSTSPNTNSAGGANSTGGGASSGENAFTGAESGGNASTGTEISDDSLSEPGMYLEREDGTYTLEKSWEQSKEDWDIVVEDGVLELCLTSTYTTNMKWVLSSEVTTIQDSAFRGCSSLTNVTIPDSVTEIGWSAFWYSGLTSITLPSRFESGVINWDYGIPGDCSVTYTE